MVQKNSRGRKETRQKIYIAIQELLESSSVKDISVQDICKKAGVGVGTFYHYYNAKEDAIFDISNPIDIYFNTTVGDELARCQEPGEKLMLFFRHQADFMTNYVLEHGLDNTMKLHEYSYKNFHSEERITSYQLSDIVNSNPCFDKWRAEKGSESIAHYLLCLTRGVISHWMSNGCDYNVREAVLDAVETTMRMLDGGYSR